MAKAVNKFSIRALIIVVIIAALFFTYYLGKNTNVATTNDPESTEEIQKQVDQLRYTLVNNQIYIDASAIKYAQGKMVWPVPNNYTISAQFGMIKMPTGQEKEHGGINIPAEKGTKIVAAMDGVVTYARKYKDYGLTVIINHGDGLTTRYLNCDKILVSVDDDVKAGEEIAEIGNTGIANNPHLHFEVKENNTWVNPISYLINEE